jgi:coenzyme F420 biosynthesis associated uncharacterized protein
MNLRSLGPVFERASDQLPISRLARPVLKTATSVQMGLLFGYLSRKVIGQYDLFGTRGLYFVGPNLIDVEQRAKVDPQDFRLWVALHEVTHALQDAGVPWLRDEITGFIDRSMGLMRKGPSPARVIEAVRETVVKKTPVAGLLDAILSPEQRNVIRDAQALMSIVEGHASFVMDQAGEALIPEVKNLRKKVEGARGVPLGPERAVQTAIGLAAKRRQYSDGQAFFEEVQADFGRSATERVWDSSSNIPSLEELAAPKEWAARVLPQDRT